MKTFTYAVLSAVSALLLGCGAVQNAVDCNGICDRYKSCYDKGYDSAACQTKCRNNANADTSFMSKADTCNNCIGVNSCAAASFSCPSCIGIVP
jgi:hypothetical protein